jgi:anti-sigma-K factor RskA
MNMNVQMTPNARRWNGVALAIIVALAVHLAASSDAMRTDEPWPLLLSDNSADSDPAVTLLQQRANGSLEKLVQSARESEQL